MKKRLLVFGSAFVLICTLAFASIEVWYQLTSKRLALNSLDLRCPEQPENVKQLVWAAWDGEGPIRVREIYPWTLVGVYSRIFFESSKRTCVVPPSDLRLLSNASLHVLWDLESREADGRPVRQLENTAVSIWLSRNLNADQLISYMASNVYVRPGCYGIDCAADQWFGKSPDALLPEELAFIAALSRYGFAVVSSEESATRLRNRMLDRMHRNGVITLDQAEKGKGTPCPLSPKAPSDVDKTAQNSGVQG